MDRSRIDPVNPVNPVKNGPTPRAINPSADVASDGQDEQDRQEPDRSWSSCRSCQEWPPPRSSATPAVRSEFTTEEKRCKATDETRMQHRSSMSEASSVRLIRVPSVSHLWPFGTAWTGAGSILSTLSRMRQRLVSSSARISKSVSSSPIPAPIRVHRCASVALHLFEVARLTRACKRVGSQSYCACDNRKLVFENSNFSVSAIRRVVLRTVSGLREMLSIPSLTKNSANSG